MLDTLGTADTMSSMGSMTLLRYMSSVAFCGISAMIPRKYSASSL
eukprot:XP_001709301.1 Hypothetical protein GL50803_31664 [Giardia lamblia ATCC 50803]